MKNCNYCGDELTESNLWFCDLDCEELFREENSEFVAKMKRWNLRKHLSSSRFYR